MKTWNLIAHEPAQPASRSIDQSRASWGQFLLLKVASKLIVYISLISLSARRIGGANLQMINSSSRQNEVFLLLLLHCRLSSPALFAVQRVKANNCYRGLMSMQQECIIMIAWTWIVRQPDMAAHVLWRDLCSIPIEIDSIHSVMAADENEIKNRSTTRTRSFGNKKKSEETVP